MSFERGHEMRTSRRGRRRTELEWRRAIEAWKESGLEVTEFCRQQELPKSRFYSWRKRLGLDEADAGTSVVLGEEKKLAVKFLPVQIQSVPSATMAHRPIEIFLANGRVVRFHGEVSDDTLSRIMKLAGGRTC
jgi:transposase-like protein